MRRPRMALSSIGALALAASLTLTGCDASPFAASVNGHVISQATLNNQLKQWASNKAWVSEFDKANAQQNGPTVVGAGGPGTYSSSFVATILGTTIQGSILRQRLVATGQLPTSSEVTAARAVEAAGDSQAWNQFPQSLRTTLVEHLADQAVLTPISSDAATVQSAFGQIEAYLFSNLCLNEASVPTLGAAQALAAGSAVTATPVCFDQAAMEDQPADFRDAVLKLTPGQVSQPIKTSFGYQVVQLQTKDSPGLDDGVRRVLSAVIATSAPAEITQLVNAASVKVNPAYGTWSQGQVQPPQLSS
ncbi:MAG: peptidyl-prolyl cis-trans isomerase [Acidimicrobiales bacterium]|nr:peptidyl-prolyl cis-trans isomerase [Acidimicrobiales bacterium]